MVVLDVKYQDLATNVVIDGEHRVSCAEPFQERACRRRAQKEAHALQTTVHCRTWVISPSSPMMVILWFASYTCELTAMSRMQRAVRLLSSKKLTIDRPFLFLASLISGDYMLLTNSTTVCKCRPPRCMGTLFDYEASSLFWNLAGSPFFEYLIKRIS